MDQHTSAPGPGAGAWGEFVGTYQRLMDEVMPYLPVAEQVVYHRLFRLSHGRRSAYVQCRYEDLALHCGLSLRTMLSRARATCAASVSMLGVAVKPAAPRSAAIRLRSA